MSSSKIIIIVLAAASITAANIALLPRRHALPARVEVVKRSTLDQIVRAGGTLEPKRSVTYKTEFEGPVVSKHYKEGDIVKKGQLLLVMGRDKIKLDYDKKAIALDNARDDAAKAKKDATIARSLFKQGAVARSNVDDAERAVVRTAQALRTAEEDFRQQQERWNKHKFYAEFDGTIVKDNLGIEPTLSSGKEFAILADLSEISVIVKVDEIEIGQVEIGQIAGVRLQAYDKGLLKAKVTDIGTQADENALPVVPVTLTLQKLPGITLRPKMTAVAYIVTGTYDDILSVPLTALTNTEGETRVWTLNSWNRLKSRKVILGKHSNPVRAEVTQGLAVGERICVTADPNWANGLKVQQDTRSVSVLPTEEEFQPKLRRAKPGMETGSGKRMTPEEIRAKIEELRSRSRGFRKPRDE